jgi:hypothetical protein
MEPVLSKLTVCSYKTDERERVVCVDVEHDEVVVWARDDRGSWLSTRKFRGRVLAETSRRDLPQFNVTHPLGGGRARDRDYLIELRSGPSSQLILSREGCEAKVVLSEETGNPLTPTFWTIHPRPRTNVE